MGDRVVLHTLCFRRCASDVVLQASLIRAFGMHVVVTTCCRPHDLQVASNHMHSKEPAWFFGRARVSWEIAGRRKTDLQIATACSMRVVSQS